MSDFDLQLANPSPDPDRPSAAVLFTNVSPLPVMFLVALDLRRSVQQVAVRLVFRNLHVSTPERTHTVELRAPATRLRTNVLLFAAPGAGDPSRAITVELDTPGSACEIRVVSIAAYDA